LWTGEARVTAVHGVVPGLVRATLDARAVLTGIVASDEGTPLEGVDVAYEGRTPAGADVKRETRTAADGRYRFNYLLASSGNVRARSFRYAPMDVPVTLEAQKVSELNVSLVPLPPAGAIRIKVVSSSGVYTPDFRVRLNPPPEASLGGRAPNPLRVDPSWETREGVKVARIEFLALPAGRYHLSISKDDFFEWTGLEQDLTPPSEDVLVTINDGAANAGFVVRARSGDGEALGGLRVLFEFDKYPARLRVGTSDDILLKNVPLDTRLRWRLDRNGYQPKFGDQRAFDIEEHRPEGIVHVAELDLRRGWGEMYLFQQRGSRKPLEGVKVLFDGQAVATSGSDGFALALGPKRPRSVTLQYKDWRVANGTDLRPGTRRQNTRYLTVMLQPPRR
jgi:hypothetical protein